MVILFIILCLLVLYGVKISNYHEDYISVSSCNAIKGIFAVIILFSHMRGYIFLNGTIWDRAYEAILNHIGQLMVAMYLFYSGFGIMESASNKTAYFKDFPQKRILKTLVHFDIAVLCYIVLMTVLGKKYPISYYIGCWIGWESVGNSNWFIFVILALYAITYLSVIKQSRLRFPNLLAISLLCILVWLGLKIAGKGSWYDTIMTFPLGMWYSFTREHIEKVMQKAVISWGLLFALVVIFVLWHFLFGNDTYGICACIFCIMLVFASSKIKIDNKILQWLGTQAFAIYIMQRLPMNLFAHLNWNGNAYLFVLLSIPSVLIIAWGYTKLLHQTDNLLF